MTAGQKVVINAGSDMTAPVAFWMTEPMMFWKPCVAPLSWFSRVVLRFMFPHIMSLFQPKPTPIESIWPALPMLTALPPPML